MVEFLQKLWDCSPVIGILRGMEGQGVYKIIGRKLLIQTYSKILGRLLIEISKILKNYILP